MSPSAAPVRGNDALSSQLAKFFDATSDAVVFLDRNYNFTFLNRRAQQLLAPGEPVLGRKSLRDASPPSSIRTLPSSKTTAASMEHGAAGEFEAFYPEPLNLWLRVQSYPAETAS